MNMRRFALLVLSLSLLIFAGCSKPESKVIGKWKNEHMSEFIDFRSDKTGVFEVTGKPSLDFKWELTGDDAVKLNVDVMGNHQVLAGKLEKDRFILGANQMKAVYRKVGE